LLSRQDPHTEKRTEAQPLVTKKGIILIVDDDPDITKSFGLVLEDSGLFEKIELCNDPTLALSNFRPDMYDIALLDVKMPDLGGFELYNEIKKIDKKVRVCFVAGQSLDYGALKEEFPLLEIECLIPKPIAVSDLIKRLETELLR
jgi:two-component system, OmpR family, response regulator ChvI